MRKVKICGLEEVPRNISPDVIGIVSLLDHDMEIYWKDRYNLPMIRRNFLDVERIPKFGTAPSNSDIDAVLDFVNSLPSEGTVIVHCYMGSSRSTAMGIGLLINEGMNYKDACEFVLNERPKCRPNRRIIDIFDRHFGLRPNLRNTVSEIFYKIDLNDQ